MATLLVWYFYYCTTTLDLNLFSLSESQNKIFFVELNGSRHKNKHSNQENSLLKTSSDVQHNSQSFKEQAQGWCRAGGGKKKAHRDPKAHGDQG